MVLIDYYLLLSSDTSYFAKTSNLNSYYLVFTMTSDHNELPEIGLPIAHSI